MTDFILAGPDIGARRVDLDGLMAELGPDRGIQASRSAEGAPIIVASTDPLRLVRLAKPGEAVRGFPDYLLMVPKDTVLPQPGGPLLPPGAAAEEEPPSQEEEDADDDDATSHLPSLKQIIDRPGEHLTPEECVQLLVHNHDSGKFSFFRIPVTVKIAVNVAMLVQAETKEHAENAVQLLQTNMDLPANVGLTFDAAEVVSKALTSLRHSHGLNDAGWVLDAGDAAKLDSAEVTRIAQKFVADRLEELEDETRRTASVLRQMMRNR